MCQMVEQESLEKCNIYICKVISMLKFSVILNVVEEISLLFFLICPSIEKVYLVKTCLGFMNLHKSFFCTIQ